MNDEANNEQSSNRECGTSKEERNNKEDISNLEQEFETVSEEVVPALYQVAVHNDDFTPMEFVVEILEKFFYLNRSKAAEIMLDAHQHGRAVCGIFSKDFAEAKIAQVIEYAQSHDHPLICSMEAA